MTMNIKTISRYEDFIQALQATGFCLGGENAHGVFTLNSFFDQGIEYHTGDAEHDPWAWRMRVLTEEKDIAYAKLFFGLGGYVTREWYPRFLAVRRAGCNLEEAYREGHIGRLEHEIYCALRPAGRASVLELKTMLSLSKSDSSRFERAVTALQQKMFVTICGEKQKLSKSGQPYGWPVTVLCPVEDFFEEEVFAEASRLNPEQAYQSIYAQIKTLNPRVQERAAEKFILG